MQDYPDFAYGVMPGPTSDISPGYGVLWNYYNTNAVAAGSTWTININPVDDGYLYKIDGIFICTSSNVNVSALVVLDDRPIYRGYAKYGLTFHTYNNPMIEIGYNDKLKIEIKNEDTSSRYLYIAIYGIKRHLPGGVTRVPVPNFSGTPLSGFTPLTVQFTDASYRFPTSWDWDFGDSTPHGTVQNPIHQYSHAERYNVTLTVRNGAGFDILSRQGYVTVNGSEQLPTYTEVDPGNNLTVTPNSVSANNLPRNVDAYIYKDFGAGHFNGFEIEFDAVCYSTSDTGGFLVPIMLSNKLDDFPHQAADAVSVAFYKYATGEYRISLMRGPESAGVHYMTHTDTHHWFKLRRSAGSDTVYLTIYSDPGRTTEITTLSLGGFGTATYRYILAAVSYNSGQAYKINGVVRFPNVLSP